ncbi:KEOPS complex subunit Pcc1 [Methanobrevibacter sp.]|uniref:KEOPS complex subunit Pcc1 n=1 Tax=Methanobrevibacter sp. TaxID=66852 RepID=UPI0025CD5805|nr:KEOPS complex subunit Pcc1 [Methanobrevibacter sp.]MBR4448077.1 hypothetical protein [Methanobrevibacter sp.]
MKINGNLIFRYSDEKNAKLVFESLDVDNGNYLESKLNENKIEYNINSDKLGTFLATVDDLIASEIVVEKIIEKTRLFQKLC